MRVKSKKSKVFEPYKMKGWNIPEGMVLLVDTREQRPLFTRLPAGLIVKSTCLPIGDYSIDGWTEQFAIERKGISDFCSYVGKERDKTVEKMKRLAECEWAGLVIEAGEKELIRPQEFSAVYPETIRQALISFEVRYHVHIYYSANRDDIARWVLDRAIKFYNIKHEIAE